VTQQKKRHNSLQHPLLVLQDIQTQCQQTQSPVTTTTPVTHANYIGLAFKIGMNHLIFPKTMVSGIYSHRFTKFSAVPGAQHWMKGLCNLHGQLVIIIDLNQYLIEETTPPCRNSRIIVLHSGSGNVGFLVSEVLGIKYFQHSEQIKKGPAFGGLIARFLSGVFYQDDIYWGVCAAEKLIHNADFHHPHLE